MTQPEIFDQAGAPTIDAMPHTAQECSRLAILPLDKARLARLVLREFERAAEGATADEITVRLQAQGYKVDVLSIRPRVTGLKDEFNGGPLVETGRRRKNERGNSCAVLIHRKFIREGA